MFKFAQIIIRLQQVRFSFHQSSFEQFYQYTSNQTDTKERTLDFLF